MKRLAAVTFALALISGCTKRQAGFGIGIGVGIALTGAVVASNPSGSERNAMGDAMLGIALAGLGGTVFVGSLLGLAIGPMSSANDPNRCTSVSVSGSDCRNTAGAPGGASGR